MSISNEYLLARVEYWQERLKPLGLSHFRVEQVVVGPETPSGDGCNATSGLPQHYDSIYFWFKQEFLDETDENRLNEVIVHEWLHGALRDLDEATDAAHKWMPDLVAKDFDERIEHEQEGLIDRLARLIVALDGDS